MHTVHSSRRTVERARAAVDRRRLARAHNLADLRAVARRHVPGIVSDFVDGAAGDEHTAHRNVDAFRDVMLAPRVLQGVERPRTGVTLLDTPLAFPVALAPTGLAGLHHPDAELAAARAAARAGTVLTVGTLSSAPLAGVVAAARGAPVWFQLYATADRTATGALIDHARALGCTALLVTVDTPVSGLRERDLRNGVTLPPRPNARAVRDAVRHPLRWARWGLTLTTGPGARCGTLESLPETAGVRVEDVFFAQSWRDLDWIRSRWPGPLALKGVMTAADARRAAEAGCDAVLVSNHGGRQLDGVPATIEVLPAIAAELADTELEVLLDGGVRRGTDVLKALALGAHGCLVGRPWVWALAAGGQPGVERMLALLRGELERAMTLAGVPSVADATEDLVEA